MIDRSLPLFKFWPWLPAFRAVAETERLSDAARLLDVTPPALSRTISKLEQALGVRLFDRLARGMLLTREGTILAHQVRDSMRRLDDALTQMMPQRSASAWTHVGFEGHAIASLIHHALQRLTHHGPSLSFEDMPHEKMAAALLSGAIDLAFACRPSGDERIVCKPIGEIRCRWVTVDRRLKLPPSGPGTRIRIQPAVAPLSRFVLQHTAIAVPDVVPLPPRARTAPAESITLWRLTRTRPGRHLLTLGAILAKAGI